MFLPGKPSFRSYATKNFVVRFADCCCYIYKYTPEWFTD